MVTENPYESPRAAYRRRIRRRASTLGVGLVWTSICFFAAVDFSGLTGKEPTAAFKTYPASASFPLDVIPWGWFVVLIASVVWVFGLAVIRLLSVRFYK